MDKPILTAGPDHPITITANPRRVTVTVEDRTIADTARSLVLRESDYPPVIYVPREDVDMAQVERTESRTYCPYKGDASYFAITSEDGLLYDAVWSYESPHPPVAEIAGHLALYPDRVQIIETDEVGLPVPAGDRP
jgi:uncharacterized protein (DUF427 family)